MAPKKTKPVPTVEPFTGFPKPGLSWFQSLAVAQNREWFQANKERIRTAAMGKGSPPSSLRL